MADTHTVAVDALTSSLVRETRLTATLRLTGIP